jgi:hypothetical protein
MGYPSITHHVIAGNPINIRVSGVKQTANPIDIRG